MYQPDPQQGWSFELFIPQLPSPLCRDDDNMHTIDSSKAQHLASPPTSPESRPTPWIENLILGGYAVQNWGVIISDQAMKTFGREE